MTAPEVFNENDWCLIEWANCTRTVVHASQVSDLQDQISGSTVFIKSGDGLIQSSLVGRSTNRQELENQISSKARARPRRQTKAPNNNLIDDEENADPFDLEPNADPFDFEPSATDWAPSDESLTDSEFEVKTKRRKINPPKTCCGQRQSNPTKNVLTPSNQANTTATTTATVGRRRNARKQPSPKQFISPPKEEPIYVPLPRKIITASGKRIHILPNSTRPPNKRKQVGPTSTKQIAPNCTKQIAPNCTTQIGPNGRNNKNQLPNDKKEVPSNVRNKNQRKRTYQATKRNASRQNATKTYSRTQNATKTNTPTQNATKTTTPTQNAIKTITPTQNATKTNVLKDNAIISKANKPEQNETINAVQRKIPENKPAINNNIQNTVNNKPTELKTEKINTEPEADKQNVVNKHVTENGENLRNIDNRENDQVKKQPDMINIIIDVKTYLKLCREVRKIHNVYDTSLKVIPMKKEKKSKLKKLKKFYKAKRVINTKTVNVSKKCKKTPKQKKAVKSLSVINHAALPNTSTQGVGAEYYSDENEENDHVDDFDRSDDNILISNKFENINTVKEPKTKEDKLVPIGSGKTLLPRDKFRQIKWHSYTVATRGLLLAAFPRRVLATHSMTGKRSPAFLNKPAKMCLDPKKVADIIIEVMDRFKIRENLVRSVITTKCADESKMFKMRMQKKEREAKAKEQNTKKKPSLVA